MKGERTKDTPPHEHRRHAPQHTATPGNTQYTT